MMAISDVSESDRFTGEIIILSDSDRSVTNRPLQPTSSIAGSPKLDAVVTTATQPEGTATDRTDRVRASEGRRHEGKGLLLGVPLQVATCKLKSES